MKPEKVGTYSTRSSLSLPEMGQPFNQWQDFHSLVSVGNVEFLKLNPLIRQQAALTVSREMTGQSLDNLNPLQQAQIVLEAVALLNIPIKLTTRQFLKGSFLTGATIATGDKTLLPKPAEKKDPKAEALAAQGLAWNLLMQIKELFGQQMADFIAPAFYHTSHVTLTEKQKYDDAKKMFERLADSMLKLATVKALNEVLENDRLAFSWTDIRSVINGVILTPEQPLSHIKSRLLALEGAIDIGKWEQQSRGGQHKPERWVWRVITKNEGRGIYRAPTTLEPPISRLLGNGEIIMAKSINEGDWYETARTDNIPPDALEHSWNDLRVKAACFPYSCPEVVFVPAQGVTPTY